MKKKSSIFKSFWFWFISLFTFYIAITAIVLPYITHNQITNYLNNTLNSKATLERVRFNPFGFELRLYNFKLFDKKNDPLIAFEEVRVDFNLIKSAYTQIVHFDAFSLSNATINVKLLQDGTINFQKLIPKENDENIPADKEPKENNKIPAINFETIKLEKTKIAFTDYTGVEPFKVSISPLNYTFTNLSTELNKKGNYDFNIVINKHTKLKGNGNIFINPIKVDGNIALNKLHLGDFWPKVKKDFAFDISDVLVNFNSNYNVSYIEDKLELKLLNTKTRISDFALSAKNSTEKIIALKEINAQIASFNLSKQDVQIKNIILSDLYTNIKLYKNKSNNIEPLFISSNDSTSVKKEVPLESNKQTKQWNVSLENFDLKNSKVLFTDKSLDKSFSTSLNNINLNVKDIDLKNNTQFKYLFNTGIDKKSKLQAKGKLSIKPLSFSSDYDLTHLPLNIFQPYLDAFLNINLSSADFNTKGNVALNAKTNKISLMTNTQIENINIQQKGSKESLINVSGININELKFSQEKNSLSITSINLIEPYAKIHIDKDKNTNFDNIVKESQEDKKENKQTQKEEEFNFNIGPIDFIKGSTDFTDLSLPLPFKSYIESLNGGISELSSHSSKPSKVRLDGVIDKYGQAKIDGSLNHKEIKQNTKINVLLKNIATKNLTPYSSEFIGRKIEGGKITLDLHYDIIDSKLDATNNIVINKIKLGEELDNSSSLPIDLAIALLEDSDGVIDLALPIDGDLDNPQFHIGDVIGDVFSNLITGIVTAPFKFLGSLLGIEGDDLQFIEFEHGHNTLLPPAIETLDNLVKIYKTRPQLALEITKTYHKTKDAYVIRSEKFDLKINAFIKELNKKNKDEDSYLVALETMYLKTNTKDKLEAFKKSFIVKEDKKDVFEDTKYLNALKDSQASLEVVTKKDLEELASGRVNNIIDYLVTKYNAPEDRMVIKDFVVLDAKDETKWMKVELGVAVKQK